METARIAAHRGVDQCFTAPAERLRLEGDGLAAYAKPWRRSRLARDVRVLEGRRLSEFTLRGTAAELAAGCAIGAAAVLAVLAILYAGGGYHPDALNPWSLAIALPLAEMAFVGVFEEVLCRSIIFRIVEQSLGSRAALVLSALLFGLAHIPSGSPAERTAEGSAVTLAVLGLLATALLRQVWRKGQIVRRRAPSTGVVGANPAAH